MAWKVPELDAITHDQLEAWINQASRQQVEKAILAGRKWLKAFQPETEDDDELTNAVEERIERLELAYSAKDE